MEKEVKEEQAGLQGITKWPHHEHGEFTSASQMGIGACMHSFNSHNPLT